MSRKSPEQDRKKTDRHSYAKKIVALLADKTAVRVSDLKEALPLPEKQPYALQRSLKGLEEAGLVASYFSGQETYTKLTRDGKKKAHSIRLDNDTTLVNPHWDGLWRVVLLDLPEERKAERDGLRYLLKKAGFICLKNAVWISPLPYEHLFTSIKKDLGLTTELIILTTSTLDAASEELFLNSFGMA